MKRFLLLLLSLILILFSSCNTRDKQNNGDPEKEPLSYPEIEITDEAKETIRKYLDSETDEKILFTEFPENTGNIEIETAYFATAGFVTSLIPELKVNGHTNSLLEDVIIFDEKVFYPNSDGEYVYLFFTYNRSSHSTEKIQCTEATLSEGTVFLKYDSYHSTIAELWLVSYVSILKIPKSSLSGEIKDIEVEFNTITVEEEY